MEWKGRRQSDNIEDQRGAGPSMGGSNPFGRGSGGGFRIPMGGARRAGGGMSIGTINFLVVIYFVLKMMRS
jgi:predicted metalloprotease